MEDNRISSVYNKTTEFKEQEVVTEITHYKGDLRIIGSIEDRCIQKTIGYAIMVEKTQKFKTYTVEQTKLLLTKFKFVNAELKNNEIINTECVMSRLMVFDTSMQLLRNAGIMILSELNSNNKNIGYRVLHFSGKIIDLSEKEIMDAILNAKVELINAKLTHRYGKQYISAIKGTFTQTEIKETQSKNTSKLVKPNNTPQFLWRKQKRIEKIKYNWAPLVLRKALGDKKGEIWVHGLMEYREDNKFHCAKDFEIIIKEILPTIEKSEGDAALLKKIVQEYYNKISNEPTKQPDSICDEYAVALCQFFVNDEEIYKQIYNSIPKSYYTRDTKISNILKELIKKKLVCSKLQMLSFTITKTKLKLKNSETENVSEIKPMTLVDCKSNNGIAQMGFTILPEYEGKSFTTNDKRNYTLKYIGEYIPNYKKYKAMASCFGDIAILAQIEQTLILKQRQYIRYSLYNRFTENNVLARIEIMLAILSIYRPDIVKEYINDRKSIFDNMDILPNVNLDTITDYKLPKEIKVYYESGFNIFLNDNESTLENMSDYNFIRPRFKKKHLIDSTYINYRSAIGNSKYIKHEMLYKELLPIVALITSERCDVETIYSVIGGLRVL